MLMSDGRLHVVKIQLENSCLRCGCDGPNSSELRNAQEIGILKCPPDIEAEEPRHERKAIEAYLSRLPAGQRLHDEAWPAEAALHNTYLEPSRD